MPRPSLSHPVTRSSGRRRLTSAALALSLVACDGAAEIDAAEPVAQPAAPDAPAAQTVGTEPGGPVQVAGADAAKASDATRALFPSGACDDIYEFRFFGAGGPGTPYMVPPNGEFHPTVQFDAPWGDETVQAIEYKPLIDNTKVTHHYIFAGGSMGWLDSWAPGNVDPAFPADVGMEMPKGKKALQLNMHYYNLTGSAAQPDTSGLAICIVRGAHLRPKPAAVHMGFAGVGFPMVPANRKNYVLTGSCKAKVKEPVTLTAVAAHMHTRGKHAKLTVTKPDGKVLTLHDADFQFTEQSAYPLDPPVVIENGDTVTTSCTYDNDTNKNIQLGENTGDEMCFMFANYYPKGALDCGALGSLANGTGFPGFR